MIEVGQVFDWIDGRRYKVMALPMAMGAFYRLQEPNGAFGHFYGHEILKLATLTKVQLSQTWTHRFMTDLAIEILDFHTGAQWICQEVFSGFKVELGEDYIVTNYELTSSAPKLVFSHGPHKCPRCGTSGALVLMREVACTNNQCPCFTMKEILVP